MKKSLIALAVLAASGSAMAQSSVTIYGLVDIWAGSTKTELTAGAATELGLPGAVDASNSVVNSNGFNTSRIGFRGTEDLGGGLKANFNIETAMSPDAPGRTSLGDRNAWVGLSGGFGEVQLGRVWTPYDDTRAMANDTFNANIAASFNSWLGYTDRTTNGIRYNTPSFGGFSAAAAYAFGEDKTSAVGSKASSLTSLSVNYANGPVVAGVAYQQQKSNGTGGLFDAIPGALNTYLSSDDADLVRDEFGFATRGKSTYTLINGSYDLGIAKLVAGYNNVKLSEEGVAGSAKANEWNVGVEAPLGANLAVGIGYAQSKLKFDGAEFLKSTSVSAALKYNMSKRTFAYAALNQSKIKVTGTAEQAKGSLYAVGIQHSF